MGRQLVRLTHGERGLEIGFDHIFGRRQDVRDEVVAELDVGVKRTADLELAQGVKAGRDDGSKADGEHDPECNDCRRKRETNFHETIQWRRSKSERTLNNCGKHGIASRGNCIPRAPGNYEKRTSVGRFCVSEIDSGTNRNVSGPMKRSNQLSCAG